MSTCYSFGTPQFTPAVRVISAITQAELAQVTTTVDHLYQDGLKVRIDVPKPRGLNIFGMEQINKLIGTVEVIDATNFTVTIDSRSFDPFSIPGLLPNAFTCSQAIPVAEDNNTVAQAVANTSGRRNNVV
jgi:hypothetical protein